MFGLGGSAPRSQVRASATRHQMRTSPLGVWNWAATMPGVPLGATHSTFTSSSGWSTDWPSQSETRAGSPAISRPSSETSPLAPALGWFAGGRCPTATKNGSCGSACRPLHAELLPEQLDAVGAVPVAVDGLAAEACLVRRDVVDRDDPAQPAAAELGAGAHRLAEGGLVGCRVVEHLDDLEVRAVGQREDRVAGAEPGMDAAVGEVLAEQLRESFGRAGEPVRARLRRRCGRGAWLILTRRAIGAGHRGRVSVERQVGARVGRVQRERRARAQVGLAAAGQHVVRRLAHQLDQLGGVGQVDRLDADVRLGVAGAVPVEVVAAGTPAAPVVLADRHLDVGRVVGALDVAERTPDRQLPAHVRLGLDEVHALAAAPAVQRAAVAALEAAAVEEDAGAPVTTRVLRSPSSSVSIQPCA